MKDHKTYAIDESRVSRASWACTPLLILPMTLGFLTAPVHEEAATADEQPSESTSALQEIVVTAQRKAQNLQDVPIAVTAMTDAQAQSFGIRDLQGVTIGTPALIINNASDFENIRI